MFSSKLEFKGAVIGLLLGKAILCKAGKKGKSCYLLSKEQEEGLRRSYSSYVEYSSHKQKLLSFLTKTELYPTGKHELELKTMTHPVYSALYERMYCNGRKSLDEHVIKCLSPHGLALLFQDMGHATLDDRKYIGLPHLNTVEIGVITRFFQKKFGLQWRLGIYKGDVGISLREKDNELFDQIVEPYFLQSYLHPRPKYGRPPRVDKTLTAKNARNRRAS